MPRVGTRSNAGNALRCTTWAVEALESRTLLSIAAMTPAIGAPGSRHAQAVSTAAQAKSATVRAEGVPVTAAVEGPLFKQTVGRLLGLTSETAPASTVGIIHWGDGQSSNARLSWEGPTDLGAEGSHAYAQPGRYTMTIDFMNGDTLIASGRQRIRVRRNPGIRLLDPSFKPQRLTNAIGLKFTSGSFAMQGNGKAVIAGLIGNGTSNFVVSRYNYDGSVDTTFGNRGAVTIPFASVAPLTTHFAFVAAITIQTDGKILLVGCDSDPRLGAPSVQSDGNILVLGSDGTLRLGIPASDLLLARLNPDGSLDSTFGTGGRVVTPLDGFYATRDLKLQTDGKIVVAAELTIPEESERYVPGGIAENGLALLRYNPDGSLDTSFGTGGIATLDRLNFTDAGIAGISIAPRSLSFQSDGKLLVAAAEAPLNSAAMLAVVRFNTDGALDTTFGQAGEINTGIATNDGELVMQGKKILVVGNEYRPSTLVTTPAESVPTASILERLNADGSIDRTFGRRGKIVTNPPRGGEEYTVQLLLTPDGKILEVGGSVPSQLNPSTTAIALRQFTASGHPDASFGAGGEQTLFTSSIFGIGAGFDQGGNIVVAADGPLLVKWLRKRG